MGLPTYIKNFNEYAVLILACHCHTQVNLFRSCVSQTAKYKYKRDSNEGHRKKEEGKTKNILTKHTLSMIS